MVDTKKLINASKSELIEKRRGIEEHIQQILREAGTPESAQILVRNYIYDIETITEIYAVIATERKRDA